MPGPIPVYHQLHHSPDQALGKDWFGNESRFTANYSVALENGRLGFRFQVGKPAQCDLSFQQGDFIEGLWEQDVAELFVMGRGPAYQEFNVSPAGAWWSATFSHYRERIAERDCPSAIVSAWRSSASWQIEFSVLLAEIPVLTDVPVDELRIAVCAILDPERPVYLCSGHEQGGEPDFHLEANFRSTRRVR